MSGAYRFFVDESLMAVGKVLAIARKDVLHPGHRLIPEVPTGTLDPDWMPIVAAKGLVVIDRDKRIRTKPVEREAMKAAGLRVFWIAGKRDLSTWDNLRLLIRHWDWIESIIANRASGPWFQAILQDQVKELSV